METLRKLKVVVDEADQAMAYYVCLSSLIVFCNLLECLVYRLYSLSVISILCHIASYFISQLRTWRTSRTGGEE